MASDTELEQSMLSVEKLRQVSVSDCGEDLVDLSLTDSILNLQIGDDMQELTANRIFVRESVAKLLGNAGLELALINEALKLQVVYGYRALSIQKELFKKFYDINCADQEHDEELEEITHRQIAVPDVSGHPTGGAVDIQIVRENTPLDFGTKIWEFTPTSYTFSEKVDNEAIENRLLLRSIMLKVGFAPFDGEWWHFSYGDREWAAYYAQPYAIYDQVEFNANQNGTIE